MINPICTSQQYQINNTNFKARPLGGYDYLLPQKLTIYQLEQTDINYIQPILNNLEKFFKKYDVDGESARQVMAEGLSASIAILKSLEEKVRILMAFCDNTPSSLVIGNALKLDKNGGFHFSSRAEHGLNEGEADWVVTFNKDIPSEGKATLNEFFHKLLDDKFESCFVRSELPEKSSAVKFYTKMGFKKLSENPRPILRENDYCYAIGKYDDKADEIIPMLATRADILDVTKKQDILLKRRELDSGCSCKLPEFTFD